MRKINIPLVATAALLSLSLVGCSNSADKTVQSADSEPTLTSTSELDDLSDITADSDPFTVLQGVATAAQPYMEKMVSQFDGLYSEVTINAVEPNILQYTYTYADEMEVTATAEAIEAELAKQDTTQLCEQVFGELTSAGYKGPWVIDYVYNNPDGSKIANVNFECQ